MVGIIGMEIISYKPRLFKRKKLVDFRTKMKNKLRYKKNKFKIKMYNRKWRQKNRLILKRRQHLKRMKK